MTLLRLAAVVATAAFLAACAGPSREAQRAGLARIDALADAERAFASRAATDGVDAAFVATLADGATLFRPGPVDGRAYLAHRPPARYRLEWEPQRVAVASSDELGFSTGPYRLRPDGDPEARFFGQFFTVWKRAPDGRWQVLVDQGGGDPDGRGWTTAFEPLTGDGSQARGGIAEAEAAFAQATADDGLAAAYGRSGSTAVRLLREDMPPVDGLAALSGMPDADARWTWTMTDSGMSRARDLAWTMGRYDAQPSGGFFVRVWRAERGDWKIVGDVLAPLDVTNR